MVCLHSGDAVALPVMMFDHWRIQPPVWGGGGNLAQGPNLEYPKNENSTELTHYYLGMDPVTF